MEQQSEPCLLASNLSQLDTTMFTAMLTDADIPWFIKDKGTGGYMKLTMGYTIYGQDVFVGTADFERAKELLDFYFSSASEGENNELKDDIKTEDASAVQQKHPLIKGTTFRIILIVFILISVIAAWLQTQLM